MVKVPATGLAYTVLMKLFTQFVKWGQGALARVNRSALICFGLKTSRGREFECEYINAKIHSLCVQQMPVLRPADFAPQRLLVCTGIFSKRGT